MLLRRLKYIASTPRATGNTSQRSTERRPRLKSQLVGEENPMNVGLEGFADARLLVDLDYFPPFPFAFNKRALLGTDLSPSMSRSISSVVGSPLYRNTICWQVSRSPPSVN